MASVPEYELVEGWQRRGTKDVALTIGDKIAVFNRIIYTNPTSEGSVPNTRIQSEIREIEFLFQDVGQDDRTIICIRLNNQKAKDIYAEHADHQKLFKLRDIDSKKASKEHSALTILNFEKLSRLSILKFFNKPIFSHFPDIFRHEIFYLLFPSTGVEENAFLDGLDAIKKSTHIDDATLISVKLNHQAQAWCSARKSTEKVDLVYQLGRVYQEKGMLSDAGIISALLHRAFSLRRKHNFFYFRLANTLQKVPKPRSYASSEVVFSVAAATLTKGGAVPKQQDAAKKPGAEVRSKTSTAEEVSEAPPNTEKHSNGRMK